MFFPAPHGVSWSRGFGLRGVTERGDGSALPGHCCGVLARGVAPARVPVGCARGRTPWQRLLRCLCPRRERSINAAAIAPFCLPRDDFFLWVTDCC